ncbi:MAG: EamA family transporter RarD [Pseudomonadota bacterium]|jgi:chloramphenicol-sensitive protein RarD
MRAPDPAGTSAQAESRTGALYAGAAYLLWGAFPLYFKAVKHVSALEIIVHRVLWSALFVALLLAATRRFIGFKALARQPRLVGTLCLTTALVTTNWLIFVWAVNAGRVLETSLGYFINPLVSMLLGFLFLGERLRPAQRLAVGLAALGVANQLWQLGVVPWVPLALAASFGGYGLLRKRLRLDAMNGLFIETLLAAPVALGYLAWIWRQDTVAFGHGDPSTDFLLVLAGPITAIPLMLFAAGAQRLSLSTLGFLQYIVPTLTLVLAVYVFGESFGRAQFVTFGLIWLGLALYSFDLWRTLRRPSA